MGKGGLELSGSRKVVSYESTPCNIPEERGAHLHGSKSLKSRAEESFDVRILWTVSENFGLTTNSAFLRQRRNAQISKLWTTVGERDLSILRNVANVPLPETRTSTNKENYCTHCLLTTVHPPRHFPRPVHRVTTRSRAGYPNSRRNAAHVSSHQLHYYGNFYITIVLYIHRICKNDVKPLKLFHWHVQTILTTL